MEATPNRTDEGRNSDAGKTKRSWGSMFMTFLASGGIIIIIVLVAALALVINLLIR